MLVNFERRVCYLAHARTASRATSQVLKERCGFVRVTDHHEGWELNGPLETSTESTWWEHEPESFLYLMTIRNPWDVIASWWVDSKTHISHPRIGPEWFEAFRKLHPKLFPPTDLWPFLANEPPGPVAVMKYEILQAEILMVASVLRLPRPDILPWIGKTQRDPDYRTYYDDESRDWVAETFPRAVQAGRYEF